MVVKTIAYLFEEFMGHKSRQKQRKSRFFRAAACLALASLALQLGLSMLPMPMLMSAGMTMPMEHMPPDCDMMAMGEGQGGGKDEGPMDPMDPMSSCFICKALSAVPLALDVPANTSWQHFVAMDYQWQDGSSFSVFNLPRGFSSRAPPIPTFS